MERTLAKVFRGSTASVGPANLVLEVVEFGEFMFVSEVGTLIRTLPLEVGF